jgi:competence protein ComEA
MVSASERRALILVTTVLCLGVVARIGRARGAHPEPTASEQRALDFQIARVESARAVRQGGGRGPRPARAAVAVPRDRVVARDTLRAQALDPPHPLLDVDRASATEMERLPYVGQVLADRIVADRTACGPFGSLEELKRVRGIGDALAARLAPLVTFSAPPRPRGAAPAPMCPGAVKRAAPRGRGRP